MYVVVTTLYNESPDIELISEDEMHDFCIKALISCHESSEKYYKIAKSNFSTCKEYVIDKYTNYELDDLITCVLEFKNNRKGYAVNSIIKGTNLVEL